TETATTGHQYYRCPALNILLDKIPFGVVSCVCKQFRNLPVGTLTVTLKATTADGCRSAGAAFGTGTVSKLYHYPAFLLRPDSHKFRPRAGVYVDRQDVSHPRRVELVLEKIGLQRGRFFRFQAMVERASAQGDDFVEAERSRKVLGIVEREFLPVEIAHRRMRFHNDPRFVTVDATHERAGNGAD